MANMDRMMLWGAVAVMAAVGSLSYWKISQTPKIDPQIAALAKDLQAAQDSRIVKNPAPRVPPIRLPNETFKDPAPAAPYAAFLKPVLVEDPRKRTPREYFFLPVPIVGEAKADLNGTTITWSVSPRTVPLMDWMIRKEASPTGFIIQRQCEDGQLEVIARVGPKDRSFTDLSTEPRLTYRYWVVLTGEESEYNKYPPVKAATTKESALSTEARTPTATRVKLVGGGNQGNAILRVETYDRTQKKWVGKLATAAPGKDVGTSGWTLRRLRFDNFTLVADLTDDEGVERVLTTKD